MYRYILIPILYLLVLSPLLACSGPEQDEEQEINEPKTQQQTLGKQQLQALEKAKHVNQQLNDAVEKRYQKQ